MRDAFLATCTHMISAIGESTPFWPYLSDNSYKYQILTGILHSCHETKTLWKYRVYVNVPVTEWDTFEFTMGIFNWSCERITH